MFLKRIFHKVRAQSKSTELMYSSKVESKTSRHYKLYTISVQVKDDESADFTVLVAMMSLAKKRFNG
ncbi:hypothetical protein [Colwellia piezophila]|uniref:hypothetical protein n=1 Tax=Colwellia piezophila TaxID=211668 RepID=UPI000366767C|nr:hypothetical protein [Colwellia piezophila]